MGLPTFIGLKKSQWLLGLISGTVAGMVVALVMTFLDWRLNPGGIFHQEQETDWSVVMETALSWFVPVFFMISVLTLLIVFCIQRLK